MSSLRRFFQCVAMAVLVVAATAGHAADDKKNVKNLKLMLQKAEQERAAMAREKTAAEGRLNAVQSELAAVQLKATDLGGKASSLSRTVVALRAEQDRLSGKLAETEKQLADTSARLRATESDKRGLEALGASQRAAISQCEDKNVKLYRHGVELLGAYENKGCGAALFQAEPITRLKRVEIENLVEDYREKLDEQKIESAKEVGALPSATGARN